MNPDWLLSHFNEISEAPDAVPRLRRFILDLAVRGKLVEQDPNDKPASALLNRIEGEKVPFEIPKNWVSARVGKLLNFQYGKALPAKDRHDQGSMPVFGSNGIVGYCEVELAQEPAIIIGRKGSAGALNLCDGPSWTTDVAYFLIPPAFFNIRFLFIALQTLDLGSLGKGVKPGLNRAEAYQLPVVVPPLAEQHRIVAKVDELMALCDKLEAAQQKRERRRERLVAATLNGLNNGEGGSGTGERHEFEENARSYFNHLPRLTTRPEHIQQLRHTILNLAVRGKLVPQDPKDKPALELLKRIQAKKERLMDEGKARKQKPQPELEANEMPFAIPNSWAWARLGDVIHLVSGQHLQPGEYSDQKQSGPPYITGPADFGVNGLMITRYAIVRKAVAAKGQILLTVKGASVGKTAVCNLEEVAISRQLMAMTAIKWSQSFLLLTAHRLAESLKESARSLIPGISREDVDRFVFPLPPLAEQHRIVAKVDEIMTLCDELESRLNSTTVTRRQLLHTTLHETLYGLQEMRSQHRAGAGRCSKPS